MPLDVMTPSTREIIQPLADDSMVGELSDAFTDAERGVVTSLRVALGLRSDRDAIACALFVCSLHAGVECPAGVFDVPWNSKLSALTRALRRP